MVYETEMISLIESTFKDKDYSTFREVPLLEKRIDIVGINPSGHIIAIEAKVEKWKKALSQAMVYRLCADEVYIAIWHEYLHRVNRDLLSKFGIGLIEVNGSADICLKANPSRKPQLNVRNQLLSTLDHQEVSS